MPDCRAGKASRAAARALTEAEAQEAEVAQAAQLAQLSSAESGSPAAAATEGAAAAMAPAAAELDLPAVNTTDSAHSGMDPSGTLQQPARYAGLLQSMGPLGSAGEFAYPAGLLDTGALAGAGEPTTFQQQDNRVLMSTHPDSAKVQRLLSLHGARLHVPHHVLTRSHITCHMQMYCI